MIMLIGSIVVKVVLVLGLMTPTSEGAVKLASVFSSHMVIQQKMPVKVWGTAKPAEQLRVRFDGEKAMTKADRDGEWAVTLKAVKADGKEHVLTAKGKGSEVKLTDVVIGEVWLASGQSNMEYPVGKVSNAYPGVLNMKEELARADHPQLRLLHVPRASAAKPVSSFDAEWHRSNKRTVYNFSAVGYFYGRDLHKRLGVPVGIIEAAWGGTTAEAWTSLKAIKAHPSLHSLLTHFHQGSPYPRKRAVLYNAMIHPLVGFPIRGMIWYQGESNVSRAYQYRTLFPVMIRDWRAQWGEGAFPFYFVQIAPYRYGKRKHEPELWDAQLHTLKTVANTGMVVTTDVANLRKIHPRNKQAVGRRLMLWALAKTYKKSRVVFSGPIYQSLEVHGNCAWLIFEHVDGGLKSIEGRPLNDFAVEGKNRKFYPAKAKIEDSKVVVWSEKVKDPAAVRYGWSNTAQPNLENKASLPASPFRTDNWPEKTQ